MTTMTTPLVFRRRRSLAADHPVELRFVDMLLIIIATLMIVTVVLSVVSAITGSGRPDIAPTVTTRSAPTAIAGQPYQLTLAVHGGDGDYKWEKAGGELPTGLTLADDGLVEGTPTRQQTARVGVRVRDGSGRVSEARELTFAVQPSGAGNVTQPKPRIATTVTLLDDAVAGQMYRHKFTADSGTAPYRWRADSPLPKGLQLAPDGTLEGRPEAGTSTFTVTMTENGGAAARQEIRLVVREAPNSWFWWFLNLLKTIFMWAGLGLILILIAVWLKGLIFGRPPREYYDPGRHGWFGKQRSY
jgi:hypothetical protein